MTKREIYEALARGEWEMIERQTDECYSVSYDCEASLLSDLADSIHWGFNSEDWRMRKENDEQD